MFDYNQKWGWGVDDKRKKEIMNTLPQLQQEQVPGPIHAVATPDPAEQILNQAGAAVAMEAVDSAIDGATGWASKPAAYAGILGEGASSGAGSQAAMLAEQTGAFGAEGLSATAGAAGSTVSSFAPLGAALGGVMKGEYDEAAGAAAGAMIGSMFGPLGTFAGSKLGGMAGNAVGSMFGFEKGTTAVGIDFGQAGHHGIAHNGLSAQLSRPGISIPPPSGKNGNPITSAPSNPWGNTGSFNYYGEQRANPTYNPAATGFAKIGRNPSGQPTGGKGGTSPPGGFNPAPNPTPPVGSGGNGGGGGDFALINGDY
jgi:hypothetical protein